MRATISRRRRQYSDLAVAIDNAGAPPFNGRFIAGRVSFGRPLPSKDGEISCDHERSRAHFPTIKGRLKAPEISTPDRHPTATVAPMSPGSTPCLCQSYPQQLRRPMSSAPSRTKQRIGLEPPGRIKNVGYFSRWHVPGWKLPRRWSAAAFACSREAMAAHQHRVS